MIKAFDSKMTANEFAKYKVYTSAEAAFYFTDYDAKGMTEKEIEAVSLAIERQMKRVAKLLNIDPVMRKAFK